MNRVVKLFFVLAFSASMSVWAEETRATLLGVVQDSSGALIAEVPIVATNVETNVASEVVTNDRGYFEIVYLLPGTYSLSAAMPGFKQFERSGIVLGVNARTRVDVVLEVGDVNERIVVTAESPLLETTNPSGAASLDHKHIANLPVFGDNTMLLTRIMPGTQWVGHPNFVNLHSNMGASEVAAAGAVGGSEFTLDGVPNHAYRRRIGFLPATDSVQEIRVESAPFDASKGHTSGATISMLTKTGTNYFHGTLSWGHWQQRWNATDSPTNRAYWGAIREAERNGDFALAEKLRSEERQTSGHENNYGATLGGPFIKNKLFFFASYNGYQKAGSEESTNYNRTVPTEAHRRGDFSDLLALGPEYQIYDPRTARLENGVVVRDPFPENQVPILNPMYQRYLDLYPLPNDVPGIVTADGENNYLAYKTPWKWGYNAVSARVDWMAAERHRVFGKISLSDFVEDRTDWTSETARYFNSNGMNRHNFAATLDWVYLIGPQTILNTSVAFNRFREGTKYKDALFEESPSGAGLPAYVDEKAGDPSVLPAVDFSAYDDAWNRGFPLIRRFSVATVRADLTKILGTHSVKTGLDLRRTYSTATAAGNRSGYFAFRNDFVRETDATSNAATRGLEWAAFMLGVPTTVYIDTNDDYYLTNPYLGAYVQDDWRLSSKLTLNLGLRYEIEGGFVERYDRSLAQFDPTAELPISAAAEAAYVENLKTLTPAQASNLPASISVRGGSQYLGKDGWPRTLNDAQGALLPRVGFAYQLSKTTVLRAGYGHFADTVNVAIDRQDILNQAGYSRRTTTILTNDNGLTFNNADLAAGRTILSDPFPVRADGTRFDQPIGNALGLMQVVGGAYDYSGRDWRRALQKRWRLGVQQELSKSLMVEVAWLGSRTDDIPIRKRMNPLPEQYWASGNVRNSAIDADLNTTIPNPFAIDNFADIASTDPLLYSDMANRGFYTASTIRKHQLLRDFPHMTSGNGLRDRRFPAGESKYDHIELSLRKRFSGGYSFMATYTRTWAQRRDWYANEFDAEPTWTPDWAAVPNHLRAYAVAEAPFGKGKPFFQGGILGAILGGWRIGALLQWSDGATYDFGTNLFWYGDTPSNPLDPNDPVYKVIKLDNPTTARWFNVEPFLLPSARAQYPDWATNSDSFAKVVSATNAARPGTYHRRMFPIRFNFLRGDPLHQVDVNVTRSFGLGGNRKLELRADIVNLFNTVQWRANPNTNPYSTGFGQVTQQWNTPRWITLKARVVF